MSHPSPHSDSKPLHESKQEPKHDYDVIIIGAGGAGLFCASRAARRGRKVLILDHGRKLGGKILISGGGRCNFTNIGASPGQYVSQNPHFCKSALARYRPHDFLALVEKYQIPYHEKKLGQQFCDDSAQAIVDLLREECNETGVEIRLQHHIRSIEQIPSPSGVRGGFLIDTNKESFTGGSLVIATGGLSIPKLGATDFGYQVAAQFGLKIVQTRAALDGFIFSRRDGEAFGDLAGLSADTVTETNGVPFRENILFTHAGLSGPATLQASLHWHEGDEVHVNLLPDLDALEWFLTRKKAGSKSLVKNLLGEHLAGRLADRLFEVYFPSASQFAQTPIVNVPDQALREFCQHLHHWTFTPAGTVGYSKAEVTRGGVDTDELSSKTMECKKVPGLYFIGEVVDVTGWLGGYNFQWAWASGAAAGEVV